MLVTVNGKPVDLADAMTVADFLKQRKIEPALVAVEHNLSWLPRELWRAAVLREGDRLEVVRILAGG